MLEINHLEKGGYLSRDRAIFLYFIQSITLFYVGAISWSVRLVISLHALQVMQSQ